MCSLDVPSGLDATTGEIGDPCVQATATLSLALPKTGLAGNPGVVGELYLADISIPPALYSTIAIQVDPIFATGPILLLVCDRASPDRLEPGFSTLLLEFCSLAKDVGLFVEEVDPQKGGAATYRVTITSPTSGQPLTPVAVATHRTSVDAFELRPA